MLKSIKPSKWSKFNGIFQIKLQLLLVPISLNFFIFFPQLFPYWIRNRILNADPDPGGKLMRIRVRTRIHSPGILIQINTLLCLMCAGTATRWVRRSWWITCVGLSRPTEHPSHPASSCSTWPRATRNFTTDPQPIYLYTELVECS